MNAESTTAANAPLAPGSGPKPAPGPVPLPAPLPAPLDMPELHFDYSQFQIEDGKPMDSIYQEKQLRLLAESLRVGWSGPPDGVPWLVAVDVGVFWARREPPIVPDVLVAFDVVQECDRSRRETLSYFIWERGKAPDIAIEFVTNNEGGEDTTKLRTYGRIGVSYYVIFDPDHRLSPSSLRVFKRQERELVPTDERILGSSGLGLILHDGEYEDYSAEWLRWTDRDGNMIPTGVEVRDREQRRRSDERERAVIAEGLLDIERKRRETAEQLVAFAENRASSAESRAELLARRLAELGIDPASITQ